MLLALILLQIGIAAVLLTVAVRALRALEISRRESTIATLLATFGRAAAESQGDPPRILAWYPAAQTGRKVFPEAFQALDRAAGGTFPFTKEQMQAAHARCTSDWLAWERAHDAEYALKTAIVEEEIARGVGQPSPVLRTQLAAVEREKLERYQQRYEEYIKTAKALAALTE